MYLNQILYAVWYAYPEDETQSAKIILAQKRLSSLDQSSSKPEVVASSRKSLGNPILVASEAHGLILFYALIEDHRWNKAVFMMKKFEPVSQQWTPASQVSFEKGLMTRHPPLEVSGEELWLPVYREASRTCGFAIARYPSYRLAPANELPLKDVIQPKITQFDDRLVTTLRPTGDLKNILFCEYLENGTWSAPYDSGLRSSLSGTCSFAFNEYFGVVFNHTPKHQRFPLSLAVFKDSIHKEPKYIRDLDKVALELSYPSSFVEPNGNLHIAYTYNRKMIKYMVLDKTEWIHGEFC